MQLVIGADSFPGRHIVSALGTQGPVRGAELGGDLAMAMEGVEVVHVAAQLYSPFDKLASTVRRRRRWPDPRLVEVVRQAREAGVRRLVVMSSAGTLGWPKEGRVTERTTPAPEHPYERLIAHDEAWLRGQEDPDVVVLRPSQTFGPGEPVLSRLLEQLLHGHLLLPRGGREKRTFLAGADLGRAFLAAAERGEPGAAYLVGGFRGSWQGLMVSAAHALSVEPRIGSLPYNLAYLAAALAPASGVHLAQPALWSTYVVDLIARPQVVEDGWTRRELGWAPEVTSFSAGLAGLADWVQESAAAARAAPIPQTGLGAPREG